METHAEIKDKCDGLETRLDEIADDIRHLPFDYKIVDKYTNIDEEVHEIYEWYDNMKDLIKRYIAEKSVIEKRLNDLDKRSKDLNNTVQNLKLQAFSRVRHGGSFSQLPCNRHL
jgi:chromosome segregation ATPase